MMIFKFAFMYCTIIITETVKFSEMVVMAAVSR